MHILFATGIGENVFFKTPKKLRITFGEREVLAI